MSTRLDQARQEHWRRVREYGGHSPLPDPPYKLLKESLIEVEATVWKEAMERAANFCESHIWQRNASGEREWVKTRWRRDAAVRSRRKALAAALRSLAKEPPR